METSFFTSSTADNSKQAIYFSSLHSLGDNEEDEQERGDLVGIQNKYEELILSYALSQAQHSVLIAFVEHLVYGCECSSDLLDSIDFSFSSEEGVIIHRRSKKGITFVAIDDEGDSMFSFSPYNNREQGRRIFFDYGSGSEEAMAYRLLAE